MERNQAHAQKSERQRRYPKTTRRSGKSQKEHDHDSNRKTEKHGSQDRNDIIRIGLTSFPSRLEGELRQRYAFFHRRHPLLMNDLKLLLLALVLHIKITDHPPG